MPGKEEGINYIYSPALDLTGYGKNVKEAKESFEVTLKEFIDYTDNKKTIFDELEHLGWLVNNANNEFCGVYSIHF